MTNTWKVSTNLLRKEQAEALSDRLSAELAGDGAVVSAYERTADQGDWFVDVYFSGRLPEQSEIDALFRSTTVTAELLPETDWVSHSQARLTPICAGRFFVHGEHDRASRPVGRICIEIQAGQAFGTGHHGTTQGCLIALDDLLKRSSPRSALDVGCGSAVLAIAFAKALHTRVLASDMDPIAVQVACANARRNNAQALVHAVVADGVNSLAIRQTGPADLVMANILAKPLCDMKCDLANAVKPGGHLILSGITIDQEVRLMGAYRPFGLVLDKRWRIAGWSTLLFKRNGTQS